MSLDFTVPGAFCAVPPAHPAAPTTLEQVARLQAEGQGGPACRMLEAAVLAGEDFGADAERAWTLLLGGYQTLNQREAFEARALEFAMRFEKSPPAWVETAAPRASAPAGKTVSASLSGTLNARVEGPLKQVLDVCARTPVRIDLSRLTDADDRGCALLLVALATCRRTGGHCRLAGAGHLAGILAAKAQLGVRANEHAWLLLLDLYQRLGRQPAFEDAAVAYAVSFEVSPPSWEPASIGCCEN